MSRDIFATHVRDPATRQRLVRRVLVLRDDDDFFAAARPPRAPAVRTDIVPRPLAPDLRELVFFVPDLRAVTRPPFAPAFFFDAVEPARPPFAPAFLTVVVRRVDVFFRADVVLPVVFRLAVERFAVDFLAVERLAVDFLAVERFAVERLAVERLAVERDELVFLREAEPPLRDEVPPLREVLLFFRADDSPREGLLLFRDDPDDEDDDEEDDFVSPDWARCLLTVRAAISFARFVERP